MGGQSLPGGFSGRTEGIGKRATVDLEAPDGTDNPVVMGSLLLRAVTILAALLLTLYDPLRSGTSAKIVGAGSARHHSQT